MNSASHPLSLSRWRAAASALWRGPAAVVSNAVRAAGVTVRAMTLSIHIKAANLWRDMFNPLRGLTMARAVSYLEEGERGAYADLQWLFRFIEKRDATLRGGKRALLSALGEMDWNIKTVPDELLPPGATRVMADRQAVTLRSAYDAISNLPQAIEWLGLAEFRGFAHLEKIFVIDGGKAVVNELRPVEQWYWCRHGLNGAWEYNATATPGKTKAEPVDLAKFIVREIDDPVNEIALIAYVRKQLGRKDEDGFVESFGIPSIFAVMPQNVPAGREDEYQDLAERVISDSRGALPFGSDIKSVDVGARGVAPFRDYQKALDEEIVMAITSGQLTMMAQSGSGTLAGGAHQETFMRVVRSLARRVTSDLQRQFDLPLLAERHAGEPVLAYFEIAATEETNVSEVVKDVTSLKDAGYTVEATWVEEKTGYPVTSDLGDKEPPTDPGKPGKPPLDNARRLDDAVEEAFLRASVAMLWAGEQMDFKPLATRLQDIIDEDLSDDEFRTRLEQLREDLPDLAADVADSTAMVTAWDAILGAAMMEGAGERGGDLENAFDPDKHPRDKLGQWATKGGAGVKASKGGKARTGKMRPATEEDYKRLKLPMRKIIKDKNGKEKITGYTDLQVTDDPKAEKIAVAIDPHGKPKPVYSPQWDEKQSAIKWARIRELHNDMPGIKAKWDADVADPDSKNHQEALAMRLMYKSGLRIGGKDGGGKVESFGATSLKMEHVKVDGDKVHLDFIGKKGVRQQHTVTDKDLAAWATKRKGAEKLFDTNDSKTRAYSNEIGGNKYRVHDLRDYNGTLLAQAAVNKLRAKGVTMPSDAKAQEKFKLRVAKIVGRQLGNDPKMSLKAYISPAVWQDAEKTRAVIRSTKPSSRKAM